MTLLPLRILIIEDNEQNRYLLTFLLEKRGHTVQSAIDGASGIRKAQQWQPDLILLDIQLPTMHGYDVAAELRRHASTAHIPIVAVTSYAMPGDRERAIESGCDGYVEKPIDPDTFVMQVEAYCGSAESGGRRGSGSGC
ncbi:response regulator [Neopusillimonas maritima]|uniref:response regulator n=1 Tax=Neopusillimonas maritima TaxID=2026239 RepID=UPI000E06AFDF|nr:response regulator [Neopusillimonas maritima]